jgi:hypothetical protein
LKEKLRPAIRKKWPVLLKYGVLLFHDNSNPYQVTSKIKEYNWKVLPHPPYLPDMSPCDYDLFPKLTMPLRDVRFNDLEKL